MIKLFRVAGHLAATVFAVTVFNCNPTKASDFLTLESIGVRGGFGGNTTGNGMHEADVLANWSLPWAWGGEEGWRLQTRVQGSLGDLGGAGDEAFIATAGPNLLLSFGKLPFTIETGSSPTVLSRDTFGNRKDIGSLFQFTSYAGLNYDIGSHWRIGYRFQHMSNAGISRPDPGLNMHMFGFSFLF